MRASSALRVARRYILARRDQEALKAALDVYKALYKAVQANRVEWGNHQATVRVKNLGVGRGAAYDKLLFVFDQLERGTFYQEQGAHSQRIHVATPLTPDERIDPNNPTSHYPDTLKGTVKTLKKQIVHELVHHFDHLRMEGGWGEADKSYVNPQEDSAGYYNHPLEMNAYFQQGAQEKVDEWQELKSRLDPTTGPDNEGDNTHQGAVWRIDDFSNATYQTFLQSWKQGVGRTFWQNLTPKNQRRMQKRVYDLWYRITSEAKKIIKDLKRRGDPMADML